MSWQCNNCAAINRDVGRFCGTCGTPRPQVQENAAPLNNTVYLTRRTLLQSQYLIVREIAKGGQGVLYEATDLRTNRRVAIKAVQLEAIANPQHYPQAIARIRNEAELLGRLNHPYIVKVLELFEEDGYPYIVMEYIEGQTLARLIANVGGRLAETEAIHIARQLCAALAYLHAQTPPIIFRDMKPQNVMVDTALNARLIDFGIARRYRAGAHGDTSVFGSLGYAAPEQYGTGQTDARTDIYALGVTLHAMLTGYNPATNPNPADPLPSAQTLNPLLSQEIDDIIVRATRSNPDDRWQNALVFDQALGTLALPGALPGKAA